MFASNPYATVSPLLMQGFVVVMFILVIAGTLFDVIHKGSARYFFDSFRKSKADARRPVDGGEMVSIAVKTAVVDVLASGEFCNQRRRVAHLLGMYGFIFNMLATAVMVFDAKAGGIWSFMWWVGGLMVCGGGYWFWFFIRVDVAAEGGKPLRLMKADLFILSLLASTTLGLLWAIAGGGPGLLFALYLLATTVLFAGVPWSKFAHMFFKPAAAFEKRIAEANGGHNNLPFQTRDDPEQQKRHSMELLRDAPMDMGLGIKREAPRHY